MPVVRGVRWTVGAPLLIAAALAWLGAMALMPVSAEAQQLPVAAYSFDAGEGEVLEDLTGNGHDGTVEGADWTSRGRYGGALEFDESGDCVSIPDSPDLQLREEFTLEAWVRPQAESGDHPVIFKEIEKSMSYGLFLVSGAYPQGSVSPQPSKFVDDKAIDPLPQKVWSHVAFTFDGAKLRIFVNGELIHAVASGGPIASEKALRIGCSRYWKETFDGRIDEVRVYNRVLSAGEVAEDRATPLQTPQQLPIAAYSFDAGEGEVLEDLTGSGHDGAVEGGEWVDRGRFGGALEFNGEKGECVTVPDSEELRGREEFTLEAWVRPNSPVGDDPILFRADGGNYGEVLGIGIWSPARPEGIIGEGKSEWESVTGTESIEANVWTHLAFTYDGAKMRLYSNGTLVGTQAQAAGPTGGAGPLVIGCNPNWTSEVFDGRIDEVRVYNRVLDAGEIGVDMRTAVPAKPTVMTGEAEVLGPNEAIFLGTVASNDAETRYRFEYGTTTAYGQMAPETEEEIVYENAEQEAEEAVAYLQPNTTYHYRLVARNTVGTAVGEDKTLTTPPSEVSPEQEKLDREEEEDFTASISTLPPNFLGLNFRGLQERTIPDMEKVAETGASMYRISLEDLTHFTAERTKYDEVFQSAAANHMKVLFVLGSRHLTTNKSGLATWVERIVRRYGKANAGKAGSVWTSENAPYAPTAWEVWNEPNIGLNSLNPPPKREGPDTPPANQRPGNVDPKKFGDYLEVMSKAIKKVEPNATVILGGLLLVGTVNRNGAEEKEGKEDEINPEKFLSRMGHTDDYDAVGFHPYAFRANNGSPPKEGPDEAKEINQVRMKVRNAIVRLRQKLKSHLKDGKNKKLWITEVGWPVGVGDNAHPAVTNDIQAKLVRAVFSTIKKRAEHWKVANIFYFNYRDAPRGTRESLAWDFNTGLLDPQGNPKPAFEAFQLQAK